MARWLFAVLIASALAISVPTTANAATATGVLLTSDDVPGLRAAGSGPKVARAALGARPAPPQLRRVTGRGAAFARGGRKLRIGVFVLRSRARAAKALRSIGKGFKRVRGLADGARVRTRASGRSTVAVVLLRSNATLAAVRLRAPRGTSAGTAARRYALALAARLERVRSRTAWERALDGIRADGSIAPGVALRAFAAAYRPLPGVKRTRGRREAPRSATLAMQLVGRVWPRLSAAQRSAIDRALGAPHDASSPVSARAVDQTLTPDAGYQAIVDKYRAYFLKRLPTTGVIAIKAFKASEDITISSGGKAAADALPVNAAGEWGVGTPAYCRVRVPPVGQSQSPAALDHILAHEVFHCFQFNLMKDWRMRTAWLVEGTADWAAAVASQASEAIGGGAYREYVTSPATPLFARSYSATGFWGHADEVQGIGSLWGKLPAVFDAPDDKTSYVLAGATNASFVNTWASSTFRFGAALPAWNQVTPYAISHKKKPPPATTLSTGTTIGSSPYALRQFVAVLSKEQPLINVTRLGGSLRAGTSTKDFGLVSSDWFCAKKCVCPNGTSGQIPPHTTVNGSLLSLGLTAGTGQGGGRVTFHALDTYCKPPKPGVTVSGATGFTVADDMYCVRPEPGLMQVQMPLNAGGKKVAQVVLEIKGYSGAGTYPTGPSIATVYDFRASPPAHLWETPESGNIVVTVAGGPSGHGSRGTVKAVSSVMIEGVKSTVTVTGSWSC